MFTHHSQLRQTADAELVGLELDVDLALGRDASDSAQLKGLMHDLTAQAWPSVHPSHHRQHSQDRPRHLW